MALRHTHCKLCFKLVPAVCPLSGCACRVHAAFHPNAFESSLVAHQEGAAAAASVLAADFQDGKYDYGAPGFNQGLLDAEDAEGDAEAAAKERPQAPQGPVCLWKPERVVHDYKAAKKLVAVVDSQRGLNLADNPLLPHQAVTAAGAGEGAQDGDNKDVEMGRCKCSCCCYACTVWGHTVSAWL